MDKVVLPYEAKGLPLHVLVPDWGEARKQPTRSPTPQHNTTQRVCCAPCSQKREEPVAYMVPC